MLRDREGRKLWIQTERGEFDPLESYQQIDERRKSQDGPDWWVVAKEPDWAPPKRRMSLVAGGLGGHTKPNSHGDQQPYDELGRYAGPGEGAWSEKPKEEKTRSGSLLTTLLGRDGDDFLAGGAGRDVLSLDGEYRAEAQGPDESRYRAKARLDDLLELPDWPSRDDLPKTPHEPVGRIEPTQGNSPRSGIRVKDGVDDSRLEECITKHYSTIADIFKKNDSTAVITSTYESDDHKPSSLHYKNRAIDLRANDIDDEKANKISKEVSRALGPDYDVLFEKKSNRILNHIHIEYDPKKWK